MSPSRRSRRRKPSRRLGWWFLPAGFVVILLAGALGVSLWAKRYLRSEAFRQFLSGRVSQALGVEGEFAPLAWTDGSAYSDGFDGRGSGKGVLDRVEAHGIRATVDLGSFRRDAWEVEEVKLNRLAVNFGSGTSVRSMESQGSAEPSPASPASSSFWSRWLPQRVDLGSIRVLDFDFETANEGRQAKGQDLAGVLRPRGGDGGGGEGWDVVVERGGSVTLGDWQPAALNGLEARFREGEWFIHEARLELLDHASLTTSGEIGRRGQIAFRSDLSGLNLASVLEPDWRQRVSGVVHAQVQSSGVRRTGESRWRVEHAGKIQLEKGVLVALPVLDQLVKHTRSERFRRLVLDEAEASFEYEPSASEKGEDCLRMVLSVSTDRLLQVSGIVEIAHPLDRTRPRPLTGNLEVGVAREVLKWLPGAEKRVFTTERSGYLFTPMQLGGTLEAPEEDLSPRLRRAAVEETIVAVPDAAIDVSRGVLDAANGLLGNPAGGLLENLGGEVLDRTDQAINEGLRMVPILDLGGR